MHFVRRKRERNYNKYFDRRYFNGWKRKCIGRLSFTTLNSTHSFKARGIRRRLAKGERISSSLGSEYYSTPRMILFGVSLTRLPSIVGGLFSWDANQSLSEWKKSKSFFLRHFHPPFQPNTVANEIQSFPRGMLDRKEPARLTD